MQPHAPPAVSHSEQHWHSEADAAGCLVMHLAGSILQQNAGSRRKHMLIFNLSTHDLSANAVAGIVRRLNHVMASVHWLLLGQQATHERDSFYIGLIFSNVLSTGFLSLRFYLCQCQNFPHLFIYQRDICLAIMKVTLLTIETVTPEKFYCHLVI